MSGKMKNGSKTKKKTAIRSILRSKSARRSKTIEAQPIMFTEAGEDNAPQENTSMVHIRRCHLCDAVTEQSQEVVTRCAGCGKFMAPFYFFNDAEVIPLSDSALRPDPVTPDLLNDERLPLRGFTAIW